MTCEQPASLQHQGRDLAREGPLVLGVHVLGGHADGGAFHRARHGVERGGGRPEDHLDVARVIPARSSLASATASGTVLYIFQLPAIRGRRIVGLREVPRG